MEKYRTLQLMRTVKIVILDNLHILVVVVQIQIAAQNVKIAKQVDIVKFMAQTKTAISAKTVNMQRELVIQSVHHAPPVNTKIRMLKVV